MNGQKAGYQPEGEGIEPTGNPAPQHELFEAQTQWFHIFKTMIDSGELATFSGPAIKGYLVVKSFTNYATGRAFPAV